MRAYIPLFILTALLISSCTKSPVAVEYRLNLPDNHHNYRTSLDTIDGGLGFPFLGDNTPLDNPLTDAGATLGRVLFYDTRLSVNNLISCASCHVQQLGFADPRALSKGFFSEQTRRNSKGLANMRLEQSFFWDSRAHVLEEQVLMPVADHIEMGMEDHEHLLAKLNNIDYYPELFEDAFGSSEITTERMSKALAQFLRSMVSLDTKYDLWANWLGNSQPANFTPAEERGRALFMEELHCGGCHNGVNLSGWGNSNIGLDQEYTDNGAGEINMGANGSFRIPSLRNVAVTGPYMHDGRFETLEEVIEHYASNVQPHDFLDFRLRVGGWSSTLNDDLIFFPEPTAGSDEEPIRLNLSDGQVQDIIAFLETMTDQELLTHERFSNPFVRVD